VPVPEPEYSDVPTLESGANRDQKKVFSVP
jgi:hypothetical protein